MDATIVIPILAGLIGAFPALMKLFADRARSARRVKFLQEAKLQVDFLDAWLRAERSVSSENSREEWRALAADRLSQLMAHFIEFWESAKPTKLEKPDEVGVFRRVLLAYWPTNTVGWVLHIIFYVTLALVPMFLLGVAISESGEPELNHLFKNWLGALGGLVFFIIILVPVQRMALRVDRR